MEPLKTSSGSFTADEKHVRFSNNDSFRYKFTSIQTDKISSIEYTKESNPIFLLIAFFCGAAPAFIPIPNGFTTGAIFAFLFVIVFFITQKKVIKISSASASIDFPYKSLNSMGVQEFINEIESRIP